MSSKRLLDEEVWRDKLGLFPMPLFQDKSTNEKFVLLNGGNMGNLCLDFMDETAADARNYAWSADVGHYLIVDETKVTVFRWDTIKPNKYDSESVLNKIEDFYDYLKKQDSNKEESVIKFGIQIYRQIRSVLRDTKGSDTLNVLLYLFASVADNLEVDSDKLLLEWALNSRAEGLAKSISTSNWNELQDILINGLQTKGLKPDINLILRHASGSLFQEAHFETLFPLNYQQTLPGFLPKIEDNKAPKGKIQTSAHFTPTSVVRTIVEEAIKNYSIKDKAEIIVLDPACGSGEFLKEFVRQIRLIGFTGKVKLIGWDVSETAIDMAKFIINYEVSPYKEDVTIELENKDALIHGSEWDVNVDFVLMNPPFISLEMMNSDLKDNVMSILGRLNNKRPNTASAFLWNGLRCLKNDGVIGCVLPTSIFENDTYIPLRKEIKDILDVKIIGRLGSHTLFSETLVDTAIFLGVSKKTKEDNPIVFWSDFKTESASNSLRELRKRRNHKIATDVNEKGYSLYRNSKIIQNNSWMPIPQRSFQLLDKYSHFTKVKDVFEIHQGARTGLNAVFLIPKEFYLTLTQKEKKYFRPAVTSDSIVKGALNDKYYMFFPETEKNFVIESETDLIKLVPKFYTNYLQPNYKQLKNRKGNKEWWDLTRPRGWQKSFVPKIVSKEFGKAGDFAFDRKGIFVAERSHAWFPQNDYILDEIGYAYVSVLSMPIINDFLTGLSKQLGGGNWWYLSSKYLYEMPIPDLFSLSMRDDKITTQLIEMGIQISSGESPDNEQLAYLSNIVFNG